MNQARIIRGVRVATPEGIRPASVHIALGKITAVAGYEEVPRQACPEELGKALLMPALRSNGESVQALHHRLAKTWTQFREQDQPLEDLIALLCVGQIAVGQPANFVTWHPERTLVHDASLYGQVV